MPRIPSAGEFCRQRQGSALVIVLLFVILLTAITIAFLSRTLTASKVSASSTSETKVNLLAASASDLIIGDLKQEIVAGSTDLVSYEAAAGITITPPTYYVNWPVYVPKANTTMIPFQNGVPAGSSTIFPNLISRSVSPSNTTGNAPAVNYTSVYSSTLTPPNRAAMDATANTTGTYGNSKVNSTVPSLNGRYISAAQWNSHYLLARTGTLNNTLLADSTPNGTFVPPDWVVVTRGGANSVSWTGSLSDATIINSNYAVGRYAYAVYNEGGMLDMNVAGYPSGLTAAQQSRKGSLALADLTQLSSVTNGTLTQTQVDNIVGWRNYASSQLSQPSGYSGFTFTATTASNWLNNFALNNSSGFMSVYGASGTVTPPTDQAFLGRQQLIALAQSLSIKPDLLQYMGTFSRSLEQPSFVPDAKRPKTLVGTLPAQTLADSYLGNNDAYSLDDQYNVPFQGITWQDAGYNRFNGTPAVVGEPLVKTKFPLSRLAMFNYNSTTATGKASIYKTVSNPDPFLDWFGLTRSSATAPWVYNHGSNKKILKLAQVAALDREPDFAELLKAAITAGSLAKGGPNRHNNEGNFQYTEDTTSDAQILQIMADLIDQYDTDSYPTRIQYANAALSTNVIIYGIEDLPGFYRYHLFPVVDVLPKTVISRTAPVTFPIPAGSATLTTTFPGQNYPAGTNATAYTKTLSYAAPITVTGCAKVTGTAVLTTAAQQGEMTYFMEMDIWNPHDPNTLNTSTTNRPPKFRVYLTTSDPFSTTTLPLSTAWNIGAESRFDSSADALIPENDGLNPPTKYYNPISAGVAYTGTSALTTQTFTDNGGKLFREPTILWNANPTGINLTGPSVTDTNTGQKYYGIVMGKAPITQQFTIASTPANAALDGTYIVQAYYADMTQKPVAGGFLACTAFLQYQDILNDATGNTWITYDAKYFDFHNNTRSNLVVNKADFSDGSWQSPIKNNQFQCFGTCMDPRTDRWGVGDSCPMGTYPTPTSSAGGTTTFALEPTANTYISATGTGSYASLKNTYFSVVESNRARADPGDVIWYSNPCASSDPGKNLQMRWFSPIEYRANSGTPSGINEFDGLFSQNNPNIASTALAQNRTFVANLYNEDPDGVARRASGGYADTSLTDDATPAYTSQAATSTKRIGLPMATASTLDNFGVATATSQSQSRPVILNRPFRNVGEMSYAFRGTPWKNIDFFNPESGDSALLDVFCISEPPVSPVAAGKVDLNTRNAPVIQAIVAGSYQDEMKTATTPPAYALPAVSSTEAGKVASTLVGLTSDNAHAWRGPLQNIGGLVGRYIATPGTTTGFSDFYSYTPPANANSTQTTSPIVYAGLSSALDCTAINGSPNSVYTDVSSPKIQRFRESSIRPLADAGQVRVWNLLIDLVVQTGRYPKTATGLDQFWVDGQKRVWIHVAIDRMTGQILDKQVEVVNP